MSVHVFATMIVAVAVVMMMNVKRGIMVAVTMFMSKMVVAIMVLDWC